MVNDTFRCIGNVSGIPDYLKWSELRTKPENVHTVKQAPASHALRVRVRSKCAADMAAKYGYTNTDTDVFGADVLDFEKWAITDHSVVERIGERLGLKLTLGRVQVQRSGQMVMPHRDDLSTSYLGEVSEIEHYYKAAITDEDRQRFAQDPQAATRVLIMLEDWRIGQGFTTEHGVLANWRSGDVYAWNWPTEVHGTFNNGYWSRPLLRLSGMTTDRWRRWFSAGGQFELKY